MSSQTAVTRLYISPFNPTLQDIILKSLPVGSATNVSFHDIQTFPEKSYGYLNITSEEAQKLKKKFNGATLRGIKMRVDEAKVEKHKSIVGTANIAASTRQKKRSRGKEEAGVLGGVELPSGRKIKRGWTSDSKSHTKAKKHGNDDKLLFRTELPPNVAAKTDIPESTKTKNAKKNKSEKRSKSVEVKEFTKSTKYPSFLRDDIRRGVKRSAEYGEGTGWKDADGQVIEAEHKRPRTLAGVKVTARSESSSVSSEDPSSESSVGDSDGESSNRDNDDVSEANVASPSSVAKNTTNLHPASTPIDKSMRNSPSITLTQPETTPSGTEPTVHPLESIFKRPLLTSKTTSAAHLKPIDTSFSFFDEDNTTASRAGEIGHNEGTIAMPQTPFTRRDLATRGIRSAAPTPDTAAIGRRFAMPWKRRSASVEDREGDASIKMKELGSLDSDDDVSRGTEDTGRDLNAAIASKRAAREGGIATTSKGQNSNQTEWEKQFWEQRGEFNRSWKARRREKRKESRQTANRKSRKA